MPRGRGRGCYSALKDGRTLPIKFWIEDGAIAPPLVEIVVDGTGHLFGPLPNHPECYGG